MQQQHRHITPEQWDALAAEPEFRALVSARRRFIIPATIFFVVYYFALPVSVGFAPQLMSRAVWGPAPQRCGPVPLWEWGVALWLH